MRDAKIDEGVVKKSTSSCDVDALKKCLEENNGNYVKCQAHIEAFKSCSIKRPHADDADDSPNQIKSNASSFKTVDHGATSGAYAHEGKRPSQNQIKPDEASGKYDGRDQDHMKLVNRYPSSPVKPNLSSFTAPERYMPRGYSDVAGTRHLTNQVAPSHASGNFNRRPESRGIAYDSQEETSEGEEVLGLDEGEGEDDSK